VFINIHYVLKETIILRAKDVSLECDGVFSINLTRSVIIEGESSSVVEWELEGIPTQYGNLTCSSLTVEIKVSFHFSNRKKPINVVRFFSSTL
jgi:hypothetical protein